MTTPAKVDRVGDKTTYELSENHHLMVMGFSTEPDFWNTDSSEPTSYL